MISSRYCLTIGFALLVCTLSGCSDVNTRIGWPWIYVSHGFWPVIGLLVVGFLIVVGFAGICAGHEHPGHLVAGLAIWGVAGLLLQTLPHTERGIQFVPLFPWQYCSWLARLISVALWLCLISTLIGVFSSAKGDWESAVITTCLALALNASLSFCRPDQVSHEPDRCESALLQSCRAKAAECERLKRERAATLERLVADRDALVARIKGLGLPTKGDVMRNRVGRTLAEELEQVIHQIAAVQAEVELVAAALEQSQSLLRCLQRQGMLENHGRSSKEDFARLAQIDRELQEARRAISAARGPDIEVRLDRLLDEILGPPAALSRH